MLTCGLLELDDIEGETDIEDLFNNSDLDSEKLVTSEQILANEI